MQGAQPHKPAHRMCDGITPAYAGNTLNRYINHQASWDHPRVCGEHFFSVHNRGRAVGSSPRMRGTHARAARGDPFGGIIPAYAENTKRSSNSARRSWDHPRVCGGTRRSGAAGSGRSGIIPAYAGSTPVYATVESEVWDHPRVCGEHPCPTSMFRLRKGSSPHMRGALPR